MEDDSHYPNQISEITENVLDLHLHFSRIGILKRPVMPMGSLDRKYAFIDSQVAFYLFPKSRGRFGVRDATRTDSDFFSSLGFSVGNLNEDERKENRLESFVGNREKLEILEKMAETGVYSAPSGTKIRSWRPIAWVSLSCWRRPPSSDKRKHSPEERNDTLFQIRRKRNH